MPRISLRGFKDPLRRPRFIVWTGTVVVFLAAFVVLALGVVSTRWFCSTMCHKVQDDTIIAYSHSSHSEISCFACHVPVNAGTPTLIYYKIKDALGIIPTLRNTFELPLNGESELALNKEEMPERTCTQCHHMATREVTPHEGIIIDHEVHSKAGYQCTVCHNRVAHKEDFELTLPGNHKHEDFMTMDACFRCHGLQPEAKAPGRCNACHAKDFTLKPAYHTQPDFYPKGHGELAKEAIAEAEKGEAGKKEGAESEAGSEEEAIPSAESVNTCYTCHVKTAFCDKCHGMEMPHPASFKEPKDPKDPNGHPALSKAAATAAKCEFCHHQSKTRFCENCHHPGSTGKLPWAVPRAGVPQEHPGVVKSQGSAGCTKCHEETYCSHCHVTSSRTP